MLPNYSAILREHTADYRGKRERAIRRTADVFEFYASLFSDSRLPKNTRPLVSAVLAYFVVSDDVIPEDVHGPKGILDDLFVAAHTYRRISRDLPYELIEEAWPAEDDIDSVMAEIYSEARSAIGKRAKEAVRMAGV